MTSAGGAGVKPVGKFVMLALAGLAALALMPKKSSTAADSASCSGPNL